MNCHACATPLSAGARFCHKCGAKAGAASAAGWRAGLPWAIAGVALGALATVLVMRLSGGGGPGESDARTARAPAAMGGRASVERVGSIRCDWMAMGRKNRMLSNCCASE